MDESPTNLQLCGSATPTISGARVTGSQSASCLGVFSSGVLRRLVRPLAVMAAMWAAACGGDGGTDPEPPPQPNRPPVVSGSLPAQTITTGESITVSVATAFSDPDGDALTYSASSSNTGIVTASVSGSTVTVTGVAAGMATVTVTASDPGGLTASLSASVTVEPANRAPVATGSVPAQSLTAGQSVQVDVAPFFSDPDGDALTYSASSSNTGIVTASVSGSTVTVTGVAAGMATVTVTASDPGGLTASLSASVTVEPANRAPVATGSVPAQSLTAGQSVQVDVALFFSDPDGDALTYSASSSNTGIVTASVSGSTVTVTGVAAGMATVTVTASDPGGLTASLSASVTVEPANRTPVATGSVPAQSLTAGQSVQVDVAPFFSDPDGDALTYLASSSNTGIVTASVSGSTVTVTGVAAGMATVTVTASDPGGLTASLSASVTVEPANRAPVATGSVPAQSLTAGQSVQVDVAPFFSDPDGDALTYLASSSNTGIVTASVSGSTVTVTGVAAGMATVTVTASDPGGLTASLSASVTVEPANRAPVATGSVPAQSLTAGQSVQVDVAPFFSDPDGDALTYSASSSNTGIVTASVSGSTVTLTALATGSATATVTARDPQGLEAQQSFTVTVTASADREALVAFYDAAGGDNWSRNDNWLTDAPLEDWYGVRVNRAGQVVSLILAINNLRGRIPPEIGNLSALATLDLHRNWRPGPAEIGLTGRIPKELGNLTKLNDIVLSSNELTGPIPSELGELANLARLDLGWNDLTGTIPDDLGRLTNLTDLDLAQNNLTGTIPPVIADLVSLTDLNLSANGLRGEIPSALADLSLSSLDLSFNNFSGSIPTEFGKLTNLLSLFLRNNQLTGDIPSELGGLSNLLNLHLNYNKLTGPIPDSFLDLRLFSFFAENNESVCMPNTTDFATWLSSITQHDPPPLCGG